MHTPPHIPRRSFIRTATLATLVPAVRAASEGKDGEWIDAHVHVWTPDTGRYPLASGFKVGDMKPASFTPEELFAHCKPEGVSRVVLIQMSYYKSDNRYMLDMIAGHRGTFRGVAIVDETHAEVRDRMKRLAADGVRGFRLHADREKAEAWSGSDGMKRMWSFAADSGLAICLLANPDALPAAHRMCKAYPKTRVVIDHFARIGMDGTVRQTDLDNLCRFAEFEHVYVKASAFYALGAKQAPYTDLGPMIRKLRDVYGAKRLMWASDCPFQVQGSHNYADSIALIRDRLDFLTADERRWMLCRTAEKVFLS